MLAIEEIYDAAFDRERFPRLIELLGQAFGAQSGFIGWSDRDRDAGFEAQYGNDPEWLRAYVETYAAHDVLRPHLHATPEGQYTTVAPLLQLPEVQASLFYREFLEPQGIVDNLAVNLIKRPSMVAHLALLRRAPSAPFSAAECARLATLIPHLRRAIYIQSHLVRAADHAAGGQAFAGDTNNSVLLLDADGILIEAEPSLTGLLRLQVGQTLGSGSFGAAVSTAIQSDTPVAIALPEGDNTEPVRLLIEARALESDRFGDLVGGPGAAHAVHVVRVDRPRTIAYAAFGKLYGLTATETRVLQDAIDSGEITAIGDRLGMARATARTHLHRIYEKTETSGIASLSNLAHRFGKMTRP